MSGTKILNEIVQSRALNGINSAIGAAVVDPSINHGAISRLTLHLESKFLLYNQLYDGNKSFSFINIRHSDEREGNDNGVYLQAPLKVTWQT